MRVRSVAEHAHSAVALLESVTLRLRTAPPQILPIFAAEAVGRILATSLTSPIPLPPFTNSQMDGFAVRAADLTGAGPDHPVRLSLRSAIPAGTAPPRHLQGTASPIMTGAPVPEGADVVIPVELAHPPVFPSVDAASESNAQQGSQFVEFTNLVTPGQFIRHEGEDLAVGSRVAEAGHKLTPSRIGLIAAAGIGAMPVRPDPRLLLVTTGTEVIPPGAPLSAGGVYNANAAMLMTALAAEGAQVTHVHCVDDPERLITELRQHAASHDVIVSSGGISAGAFEVVREALAPHGVDFFSIAMQPGGPQGLGSVDLSGGGTALPVLCFPGNPVSSLLSAEMFLFPWLRALRGRPAERPRVSIPLATAVESPQHKLQLRRGRVTEDGLLELTPPGSHLLSDFARADVIAEIPAGMHHVPAGTAVTTWRIND